MAPKQNQLSLPPLPLPNRSQDDAARVNQPQATGARAKETQPVDHMVLAAELFDEALDAAGLTTAEAAYVLNISESLIRRMRSKDAREGVSLIQMLKLGPRFLWEFHKALHRKEKFAQVALRDTLQALSLVAVGME